MSQPWWRPGALVRVGSREFLVLFSGPAVTADENDIYQDLAGEGERPAQLSDAPIVREPGRDFTVVSFPNANHALVETRTGLPSEMLRSDTFAPGLFVRVGDWLRAHGLGR